jgi:hypothetical protein
MRNAPVAVMATPIVHVRHPSSRSNASESGPLMGHPFSVGSRHKKTAQMTKGIKMRPNRCFRKSPVGFDTTAAVPSGAIFRPRRFFIATPRISGLAGTPWFCYHWHTRPANANLKTIAVLGEKRWTYHAELS